MNSQDLPGIAFVPARFRPTSSKHKDTDCFGVQVLVTDWRTFQPVRTGIHIAVALHELFPDAWDTKRLDWLLKHKPTFEAILKGTPADEIIATWRRPELPARRVERTTEGRRGLELKLLLHTKAGTRK